MRDHMDLMMTWVDQALYTNTIPDQFGWWFFLSILGRYQLWKMFWKVQMEKIHMVDIVCNLVVPAQPYDRFWLKNNFTIGQWIDRIKEAVLPSDPDFRQKILRQAIWMGWRLAFWQQWRERQHELDWEIQPMLGLRMPRIDRTPETQWIKQNLLNTIPEHSPV